MTDIPVIFTCTGCLHYSTNKFKCRLDHTDELALCCEDFEFKENRKHDTNGNNKKTDSISG